MVVCVCPFHPRDGSDAQIISQCPIQFFPQLRFVPHGFEKAWENNVKFLQKRVYIIFK